MAENTIIFSNFDIVVRTVQIMMVQSFGLMAYIKKLHPEGGGTLFEGIMINFDLSKPVVISLW